MTPSAIREILAGIRQLGFAHVRRPLAVTEYRQVAEALGTIVGEESIALRPGAHAYVAKPGAVPLHTDHPEVDIVAWWCEQQDDEDGASLLLDTRPILAALPEQERQTLHHVELYCPPLAGGPPSLRFPVLRDTPQGEALFCSPWLRSADPIPVLESALAAFRTTLMAAAETSTVRLRLDQGQSLFVDNRRVLHGRAAIQETSRRRLLRLWVKQQIET